MKIINIALFNILFFTPLFVLGDELHADASENNKQPSSHHAAFSAHQEEFKLTSLSKEPLQAGKSAQITLFLSNAETGAPITETQLKTVHTKKLHALIIDPTLTDYHHQHPQPGNNPGEYTFSFTPNTDNNYRIWLDITPTDNKQAYIITDLPGKNTKNPPVKKTIATHAEVNHYQFDLQFDKMPLHINQPALGSVIVKDKDAKPFTQLEPVMGAFAHIVAFSEDYHTILHVHPMGKEPQTSDERGGPQIDFHITPTTKGYVKIFSQTQINGQEIFAPFGVNVDEASTQ